VRRPTDDKRGVDHFDDYGDALGRQSSADSKYGGGEDKDERRDPKQEYVSRRVEQGPFGSRKKERGFSVLAREGWIHSEMKSTRTHRSILIEMQYTARNIPKRRGRGGQTCAPEGNKMPSGVRRTIGDAGVKVVGDGVVKLFVDRIDKLLLGVGHQKGEGKGGGREGKGREGREREGGGMRRVGRRGDIRAAFSRGPRAFRSESGRLGINSFSARASKRSFSSFPSS
jgi:hypothetical protein